MANINNITQLTNRVVNSIEQLRQKKQQYHQPRPALRRANNLRIEIVCAEGINAAQCSALRAERTTLRGTLEYKLQRAQSVADSRAYRIARQEMEELRLQLRALCARSYDNRLQAQRAFAKPALAWLAWDTEYSR